MGTENHFICLGCGLIYEGAVPPEVCPVCGAPNRAFYPRQFMPGAPPIKPAPVKKKLPPPPAGKKHWVCLGCGHIYEGDEPPEQCPFCKAPEAVFYPRQYYPRQQAPGNDALQNALNLYEGMQQGIPGSSNDGTV